MLTDILWKITENNNKGRRRFNKKGKLLEARVIGNDEIEKTAEIDYHSIPHFNLKTLGLFNIEA